MHITNFVNALRYALDLLGYSSIYLKVKQIRVLEALYHQKDVVAVLPTGYGKSVILHILPFLLEYKEQDKHSRKNAVMVIAPLNSLIDDQVGHLRKKGINVQFYAPVERTKYTILDGSCGPLTQTQILKKNR